jgi:hypothetical protein
MVERHANRLSAPLVCSRTANGSGWNSIMCLVRQPALHKLRHGFVWLDGLLRGLLWLSVRTCSITSFCSCRTYHTFIPPRQPPSQWYAMSRTVVAHAALPLLLLLLPLPVQLDASSTSADRSALTTVPQLSSAGLLKAAADLAGGRLFALLNNGHVHVWELHLTRPPPLQVGWTGGSSGRCCCCCCCCCCCWKGSVWKQLA